MGNNISTTDSDIWKNTIIQQLQQGSTAARADASFEEQPSLKSTTNNYSVNEYKQRRSPSTPFRDNHKSILTTISEKQPSEDPLLRCTSITAPSPLSYYDSQERPISRNRCHSRSSRDNARYTNSSIMGSGFSSTFGGSDSFHFSTMAADSTITDLTNASTFSINSFLDKASNEKNFITPMVLTTTATPFSSYADQLHTPTEEKNVDLNQYRNDSMEQQQAFKAFTTAQEILDFLMKEPYAIYDVCTSLLSAANATREFQQEAFLAVETWSLRPTDSFAKVIVACCRLYGWGTEKDPAWGFRDLQALAKQQGVWEAFYYLGQCYHYGLESPSNNNKNHIVQASDKERAIYWYSKYIENAGKEAGTPAATTLTTHCLKPRQAQPYVAEAQFRIVAINFAAGNITVENLNENAKLLKQSAENGNRKAEFSYALILDSGVIAADGDTALTYYERSALKGYTSAQIQLGLKLIKNDIPEGVMWLRKAAEEQSDAWAYYHLGETYEFGRCVQVDNLSAFQCYTTAADVHNNYLAQFRLGFHYLQGGLNLQKDVTKAFQYLKTAARSGYPDAQYLLGMMYRQGNIPPSSLKNATLAARRSRNEKEAFRWIRRAATQRMHTAITQIANCYEEGIGTAVNHHLATEYYEIAVKIPGKHLPSAQLTYARFLHKTGHYAKALSFYLLAAGLEPSPLNTFPSSPAISRVAQRMVALLYLDKNDTTTPHRPKEALDLLFTLAGCPEGDADAHYWIAVCYEEGVLDVLDMNLQKAYDHYLLSANLGSTDSLFQVGYMLCKGLGVKEDKTAAFGWFMKSADKNHADALYYLGIYHYNGNKPVLKRSPEEARYYFKKAAEADHVEAMVAYAKLCQDKIAHIFTKNGAFSAKIDDVNSLQNEVTKWYMKAAKKNNLTALRELGRFYSLKGDFKKSLECYLKAASFNDGLSTLILGGFYENGQGLSANSQLALKCYAKAYDLGQSTALFASAELYEKLQIFETAYAYYRRASKDPKISKQLASMSKLKVALYSLHYYPTSIIPTGDLAASLASAHSQLFENIPSLLTKAEAIELLLELAQTDKFEKAYFWIAKCYYDGNGVPIDRIEATRWISSTTTATTTL